jgi:hypothetical protein
VRSLQSSVICLSLGTPKIIGEGRLPEHGMSQGEEKITPIFYTVDRVTQHGSRIRNVA